MRSRTPPAGSDRSGGGGRRHNDDGRAERAERDGRDGRDGQGGRSDDALLTAYVDGVTELPPGERRAIEARLADDAALRAEAEATRELLGRLRELPREERGPRATAGPDWAALERSIIAAVGDASGDASAPTAPRPWWRRLGWRWALPAAVLAGGAAVAALALRAPAPDVRGAPAPVADRAPAPTAAPDRAPAPAPGGGATMALWLDGEDVEIDLAESALPGALPDAPWEGDTNLEELLPASDLAWVDDLGGDELERAEEILKSPALAAPGWRKPS